MTESPHGSDSPLLILISAPSGAGKTTLCSQLLEHGERLTRVITCTTRPPRDGEQNGIDYHFLDPEEFQHRIAAGDFLEHATVHGNFYGTLISEVTGILHRGQDALLNIDVQGHASIRQQAANNAELQKALVSIFMIPPSLEVLEERLRNRASDSETVIQGRLAEARSEIAHWRQFDYLLVSSTLDEDLRRAQAILETEHMKQSRSHLPFPDDFQPASNS